MMKQSLFYPASRIYKRELAPLDFADSVAHGFAQKAIIKKVIKKSQEGLG